METMQIAGFPAYRIDQDGNVWSLWRYAGTGQVRIGDQPRRLKLNPYRGGYVSVTLRDGTARGVRRSVHVLVLETFVGPCPPGKQARHLNGIPTDNRVANLAWGTPTENANDRVIHGTASRGGSARSRQVDRGGGLPASDAIADTPVTLRADSACMK